MCGVFAQFERSMRRAVSMPASKRARANGKTLGRPKNRRRHRGEHQEGAGQGDKGIRKIAAEFGVGSGTVQRIKAAL